VPVADEEGFMRQRPPMHPVEPPLPLPEEQAGHRERAPSSRQFFLTWLRIGAFSFGGGAATLYLLRREFVQRRRWLTGDEYNEAFALSKLTPGTNIIAQSILMGRMMAGGRGVLLAIAGLLGPAVLITTLLAAFVGYVQGNHIADAMLAGVVPATGGMLFAIVIQMTQGQVNPGWRRYRDLGAVVAAAVLFAVFHVPIPFVLIGAAALGALFPKLSDLPPEIAPRTAPQSETPRAGAGRP
jgi:chromate transporter